LSVPLLALFSQLVDQYRRTMEQRGVTHSGGEAAKRFVEELRIDPDPGLATGRGQETDERDLHDLVVDAPFPEPPFIVV
jgi:hypothetical protein